MKTMLARLGYAMAVFFMALGGCQMFNELHRTWYFDGGMAFDATGREAVAPSKPLRIGSTAIGWHGPAMLLLGALMAGSVYQLRRKS